MSHYIQPLRKETIKSYARELRALMLTGLGPVCAAHSPFVPVGTIIVYDPLALEENFDFIFTRAL